MPDPPTKIRRSKKYPSHELQADEYLEEILTLLEKIADFLGVSR